MPQGRSFELFAGTIKELIKMNSYKEHILIIIIINNKNNNYYSKS